MALTPAEKQRRYRKRINMDECKRSEYLRKMRDRAKHRKELKLNRSIRDISDREKRKQRKSWRERQRKSREKRKHIKRSENAIINITPPETPDLGPSGMNLISSQNRTSGRKKLRRDIGK